MSTTRRALLSVYDKRGLSAFARGLSGQGFELIASGGTRRHLLEAGLEVTAVSEVTDAPELLDGRVKTLHPTIHAAILARPTGAHMAELERHGIAPIDVVVCNLYPFEATVADPEAVADDIIDEIDIGGVALLRAAAKNFDRVTVVTDPGDYDDVLASLAQDESYVARRALASKAFGHTASYDAAIADWFESLAVEDTPLPSTLRLEGQSRQVLRYGENPHQHAARYLYRGEEEVYTCLQGKALSFNNLADLDAAWSVVEDFDALALAIVKHANPCGVGTGESLGAAFTRALASDPVSAFGSIIAVNRAVDAALIEAIGKLFVEVIVAPDFDPDALALLGRKKPRCRAVRAAPTSPAGGALDVRSIRGGLLVQAKDRAPTDPSRWEVVSARAPTPAELQAMEMGWRVVRHVKSNAIVIADAHATLGVGAGQMNRVDAVHIATRSAGAACQGAAMASDAFFPFPDGVEAAVDAGVTAVVQPGGSIRDAAVIEAVDRLGVAMVFTGTRHFKH